MNCPNCRFENEEGAKFCEKCGAPMAGPAPRVRLLAWILGSLTAVAIAAVGAWILIAHERSRTPTPGPEVPAEVVLRLHGSNTVGAKLAPALSEAFFRQKVATEVVRLPGKDPEEVTVKAKMPGKPAPQAIEIAAHGSATAFKDLAAGACDIGMASRRVKSDEAQALSSMGDMTAPASEHVLAMDGIAVILHPGNTSVGALTKEQLAGIFSGEITDWAKVGGKAGPIRVYARDDKSGTFDTFKALVLGSEKKLAAAAERFDSHEALRNKVASDPQGIGFVGLPYTEGVRVAEIAEKGASPMVPNKLTVGAEDYPLSRRLFLYTPATQKSPTSSAFVEFALSDEGQKVVEKIGFVGLNVELLKPVLPSDAPAEYRSLTLNAWRASLNFRFKPNSAELDNKSLRDLDRLAGFMANQKKMEPYVLLFGFADNKGAMAANLALSEERAKAVADELKRRGIAPYKVRGFGGTNFIASNETEEGRQKNRRVEVWIE